MSVPFMIDLKGKTAVVTGGGGVLCGGFSKALAECGANVAVLDIKEDAADAVARDIRSAGGNATGILADVLDAESLSKARDEVLRAFGPCDLLLNGAGGNHPRATTAREYLFPEDLGAQDITTFLNLDAQDIKFVFDLNYTGAFMPTQAFLKDLAQKKGSSIINISSMNALRPLTKIPAYSGAKAAVSNFTQWLAVHLSKIGIRVNAIAPGFFETNQNRALLFNPDGSYTERSEKILSQTPMGRFGLAEDLTGTLLWLADENASGFVNGAVIPVDGGFSAYSGV